jgi:hypothetical protein
MFIPAGTKNIEKVVKMLDYFVTEDYSMLTFSGIEGYNFKRNPDGTIEKLPKSADIKGVDYEVTRAALWAGSVFPWWPSRFIPENIGKSPAELTLETMAKEMGYTDGFKQKVDFINDYYNLKYSFVFPLDMMTANPMAIEIDRISSITPDLNTYSTELMASLIIGDKSLDNWNSYMADLKRLGLDELISIYQAQIDRAK